jgi:hypothetical protein
MRKILADGPDRPVMWVNPTGKNQSAEFTVPIGGKSFRGQIEGATGVVIEPGPLKAEMKELTVEDIEKLERLMELEQQAIAAGGSTK